jgi:hypothetical protein
MALKIHFALKKIIDPWGSQMQVTWSEQWLGSIGQALDGCSPVPLPGDVTDRGRSKVCYQHQQH